jgi:hypothetical protein
LFYKVDNDDDDDSDSDNVVKLTGKSIRRLTDHFPTTGSTTPSPLPPPPPPPPPHLHLVPILYNFFSLSLMVRVK